LFSQPHSVACGDTNYIRKAPCRKNDDGEVEIEPRNFFGGSLKFGPHEKVSNPGYICNATGDPYAKPPIPGRRVFEKNGFLKAGHEIDFCPAK